MSCKVKVISGRTVCLQSNGAAPALTLNSLRDSGDFGHWAPESALFQAFATHASGAWWWWWWWWLWWWRGVFHVCGTCVVVVQGAVVARRARHTSCLW